MNKHKKHFNIVIATPGKDMVAPYTQSLVDTINFFNKKSISFCYLNGYSSHVGEARQRTLDKFIETYGENSTYDKMIWIDSDVSWTINDIYSLYSSDKDILTGACIAFNNMVACHKDPFSMYSVEDINNMSGYEQIMYCGMAFMAVNYGILENIKNPFYPVDFSYQGENVQLFNEDVAFCIKAQTYLRKTIWLDPSIKVKHHKIQVLEFD